LSVGCSAERRMTAIREADGGRMKRHRWGARCASTMTRASALT
jgi:hypothetical protein